MLMECFSYILVAIHTLYGVVLQFQSFGEELLKYDDFDAFGANCGAVIFKMKNLSLKDLN